MGQLQLQQCVLTVVCWMWHRGVVLQVTIGVVGYVWGEAVVPRPGWAGGWRLEENKMKYNWSSSSLWNIKQPFKKGQKLDWLQKQTMLLFTVLGYLTAWSRGKRREGRGWGRRGRLSRWQQIWGRKWLGGGRSAAGWRVLNGLDGVPALYGGKALRTVKITLVLYDQRRAGDGASQRESR